MAEIQRAILSLPEDQRTALVMIDVQGSSYEETAEATGASLGTVKSRLIRARNRCIVFGFRGKIKHRRLRVLLSS